MRTVRMSDHERLNSSLVDRLLPLLLLLITQQLRFPNRQLVFLNHFLGVQLLVTV